MTKIIAKIPCDKPDCTHPHEMEIEYTEPKLPKASTTISETSSPTSTVLLQQEKPVATIEKVIEKMPSHIPAYKCKNCGDNHQNKNYTQRPKGKCTNCGQFAKDDKGSCPWCNNEVEPIDEDELDDLGIAAPGGTEHVHEGE